MYSVSLNWFRNTVYVHVETRPVQFRNRLHYSWLQRISLVKVMCNGIENLFNGIDNRCKKPVAFHLLHSCVLHAHFSGGNLSQHEGIRFYEKEIAIYLPNAFCGKSNRLCWKHIIPCGFEWNDEKGLKYTITLYGLSKGTKQKYKKFKMFYYQILYSKIDFSFTQFWFLK